MSTEKQLYQKKALTIDEQIELLKSRGLVIEDDKLVKHYLNSISYYHLSAYFKVYQNADDTFHSGISFNDILKLYFFDRKLRLLFSNAIERIEKAFKTQFVYHLVIHHGADCLTEKKIFQVHIDRVKERLQDSKEPFIREFAAKYSNTHPPLWILAETLNFGDILYIYQNSVPVPEKKKIASFFQMNWVYLHSWLENLREIRNTCAHYSRLWNKIITRQLKQSRIDEDLQYNGRIFDSMIITSILLKKVSPTFPWLDEIKALIEEYESTPQRWASQQIGKKYFKITNRKMGRKQPFNHFKLSKRS